MSGGNYIKEGRDSSKSTCIIFSPLHENEAGMLAKTLRIFSDHHVDLMHIESRPSTRGSDKYEFMVECHGSGIDKCIEELKTQCDYFNIISRNYKDNEGECATDKYRTRYP